MLVNGIELYVNENIVKNYKATIIITHGLAEHSGRYDDFTSYLNELGFNVIRYDLRGHGKSEGKRGALKSYKDPISDLKALVRYVKDKFSGKVFILGHSLGGGIVNIYASLYDDVDGVISSGAATDVVKQLKFFKCFPFQLLKWVTVKNKLSNNMLASIPEVEKAYQEDPLVLDKYKVSLPAEIMLKGSRVIKKNYDNYKLPVLIMHGRLDPIVPVEFSENLYEKISSKDKKLVIFENSLHEIFNDIERKEAFETVKDWLIDHV